MTSEETFIWAFKISNLTGMFRKTLYSLSIAGLSIAANAQNPGILNPDFNVVGWDSLYGNNNGLFTHKTLVQSDGKIVFCAEANFSDEGHQAVVVRYNPDGTPDTSFGGDGVVRTKDDNAINSETRGYGLALQSDGKLIIAGDQFYSTERIIRLNTDGTPDNSFGVNGVVDFSRSNDEFIYHVNVQSDDKILVPEWGRGWSMVFQKNMSSSGDYCPMVVWMKHLVTTGFSNLHRTCGPTDLKTTL